MRRLRWILPVLLLAAALGLPWGLYELRPRRTLDVVLLDKTVPFETRVEHRSLYWLLDFLKIDRPDGRRYDADHDYVGAFPPPVAGDPPVRTLDLAPSHVARADLLYLADSYGVYEDDLASGAAMRAALERSPKVYGGLEPGEVDAVEALLERGGIVVAEFNTLASPTAPAVRERMERLLGVRWTRWVGRYFPDLADPGDVPQWLRDDYAREWGEPWNFSGSGYVLVQDDLHVEVLRTGLEARSKALRLERRRPIDPVLAEADDGVGYAYWFDVVEAAPGASVLADFVWDLAPEGLDRLRARGLPERFPAVIHRHDAGTSYYFAGDFADNPMPDPWIRFAGYLRLKRALESLKLAPSVDEFYWRFYAPMMRRILEDHARERVL